MKFTIPDIRLGPFRLPPAGSVYLLISLWGCMAIHVATRHGIPTRDFALRQLIWIAVGSLVMLLASSRSMEFYRRTLKWWAAVTYLSLVAVLFLGIRVNGMRGWFSWHGIFCQPSEFAKPAFVMCLAAVMEKTTEYRSEWRRGYLPCLLCVVAWTLPIAAQPDFGAILIYCLAFATVYWTLGGPLKHLIVTGLFTIPVAGSICWQHQYVAKRLLSFINPERLAQTSGWHMMQFRRTLASGGLFGQPLSSGRWSEAYLPLGYSDSIFATIAESMGFIGVLPVVILIVALVAYGHYRVCRMQSRFAAGTALGVVTILAGQSFVHLSVNLGLLPPTGITLPMISYGGSSLVSTFLALGIIEALAASDPGNIPPIPPTTKPVTPTPAPPT